MIVPHGIPEGAGLRTPTAPGLAYRIGHHSRPDLRVRVNRGCMEIAELAAPVRKPCDIRLGKPKHAVCAAHQVILCFDLAKHRVGAQCGSVINISVLEMLDKAI